MFIFHLTGWFRREQRVHHSSRVQNRWRQSFLPRLASLKGHHHRSHSSEEAMIVEVAKLEREEKMYLLDMALFFVFQTTRSWKERKLTVHSTWPSWMLPKEPTDSHLWSLSTRKLIPFTTPSRHVPFFLVVFGFLVLILFTLIYVSI